MDLFHSQPLACFEKIRAARWDKVTVVLPEHSINEEDVVVTPKLDNEVPIPHSAGEIWMY